jgi:hypothetical protein
MLDSIYRYNDVHGMVYMYTVWYIHICISYTTYSECIYVYIYVPKNDVHVYNDIIIQTCMCVNIQAYTYTYMFMYIYTYIDVYIYKDLHTSVCVYTHTHTHTNVL